MSRMRIPKITAEVLLRQIRQGARWGSINSPQEAPAQQNMSDSSPAQARSPEAARQPLASPLPELVLQPEFQPHDDEEYHVNDLLRYHDRDFIRHAYRAILQRPPDATGYQQFVESLRAGRLNKIDILARLRFSPEGEAKGVRLKGLRLPALLRRLYNIPWLGYLLRLCVAAARLPHLISHQQRFEAYLAAQQNQIADHINRQGAALAARQSWIADHISQQDAELSRAHAALAEIAQSLAAQETRLIRMADEQRAGAEMLRAELLASLAAWREQAETSLRAASAAQQELIASRLQSALSQIEQQAAQAVQFWEERATQFWQQQQQEFRARQQELAQAVAAQREHGLRILEVARKGLPASAAKSLPRLTPEPSAPNEGSFYLSFEDLFRGSRADIKERLRFYLAYLAPAGIGSAAMPVLDLGCGRGEWLELLAEEGLRARGVEFNSLLVKQCRTRGFDVVEEDLLLHLLKLPAESLGAITAFHVAEHLPFETLADVVDEALRVLKPGGALIMETPNPQNVLVGGYYFYFDPTHQRPLPDLTLRFLFELKGLKRVELFGLHPLEAEKLTGDTELIERFNKYFYGPMDYAIIGWKEPA